MLAAKKNGSASATLVNVPLPAVGPDDVLVRVRACAICASALLGWNEPVAGPEAAGQWDPDKPGLTGHEVAGDIVSVGGRVDPKRVMGR